MSQYIMHTALIKSDEKEYHTTHDEHMFAGFSFDQTYSNLRLVISLDEDSMEFEPTVTAVVRFGLRAQIGHLCPGK